MLPNAGEEQVRNRKRPGDRARDTLTSYRAQREEQIRTPNESEKVRGTHGLNSAQMEDK